MAMFVTAMFAAVARWLRHCQRSPAGRDRVLVGRRPPRPRGLCTRFPAA